LSGSSIVVQPDLIYGERRGKHLTLDQYIPDRANGAAIVFVNSGGFESGKFSQRRDLGSSHYEFVPAAELVIGDSDPIPLLAQFSFERLLSSGFRVFDVRHSNAPSTFDEMLTDVRTAINWIHEHAKGLGIDPARVGIFGASSGGYLAIAAGLTARKLEKHLIRSIASYYPAGYDFPADVAGFPQILEGLPALAVDDEVMEANSIKNLYPFGGPPTLVIYGDQDFSFIVNPCRSILSEFPKAGIDTKGVVIKGAGHEFMREDGYHADDGDRAQEEMVHWFMQQLGN